MITAVIPAYNEHGRVGSTIRSVLPYVDEVIVVDDHSQDDTALEAQASGARVIILEKNCGYIAAIKRGFQEARGEIVLTIDADGEFPADYIPALIQPILDDQADMVQGHRDIIPRLSERFLSWIANLITPVGDSGSGLRALRTNLARTLKLKGICICAIFSLEVAYHGGRIDEIPIRLHEIQKPRRIAWYHIKQFFYVLPWFFTFFYNHKIGG